MSGTGIENKPLLNQTTKSSFCSEEITKSFVKELRTNFQLRIKKLLVIDLSNLDGWCFLVLWMLFYLLNQLLNHLSFSV